MFGIAIVLTSDGPRGVFALAHDDCLGNRSEPESHIRIRLHEIRRNCSISTRSQQFSNERQRGRVRRVAVSCKQLTLPFGNRPGGLEGKSAYASPNSFTIGSVYIRDRRHFCRLITCPAYGSRSVIPGRCWNCLTPLQCG